VRWKKNLFSFLMVLITSLGVIDQIPTRALPDYRQVNAEYQRDREFLQSLEQPVLLPDQAMIFQLPYVPFPEHPPVHKMPTITP
jgi:phosphoglycerol transferase